MITPKGTKPNTQHRHSKGRYATYLEAAEAAAWPPTVMEMEANGERVSIKRVGDRFTLRIDSKSRVA
jgi:hypothetical protein